jgi:hypothetical protein
MPRKTWGWAKLISKDWFDGNACGGLEYHVGMLHLGLIFCGTGILNSDPMTRVFHQRLCISEALPSGDRAMEPPLVCVVLRPFCEKQW